MREARIIAVAEHDAARLALEHALLGTFGGFTRSETSGGWCDDTGRYHIEPGFACDIACEPSAATADKLRHIAQTYCAAAKQLCVYLRLPNGNVEFVETAKAVTAA